MKKLIILITVLSFWGCDKETTAPTDCAGVVNGTAVLSGCDNACNSTLVVDDCGVCGGDNYLIDACDTCNPCEDGTANCDEFVTDAEDCLSGDDDSPPNCILDCEGFDQVDPDVDLNAFCEWVIDGGFTANDCNSDCDADALANIALATISLSSEKTQPVNA